MLTKNDVIECRCDYRDGNFFTIDAWGKDEQGEVIGVIHKSGDVYKTNVSACNSDIVKKVIREKIKELKSCY